MRQTRYLSFSILSLESWDICTTPDSEVMWRSIGSVVAPKTQPGHHGEELTMTSRRGHQYYDNNSVCCNENYISILNLNKWMNIYIHTPNHIHTHIHIYLLCGRDYNNTIIIFSVACKRQPKGTGREFCEGLP